MKSQIDIDYEAEAIRIMAEVRELMESLAMNQESNTDIFIQTEEEINRLIKILTKYMTKLRGEIYRTVCRFLVEISKK